MIPKSGNQFSEKIMRKQKSQSEIAIGLRVISLELRDGALLTGMRRPSGCVRSQGPAWRVIKST
jgi:hypothetical protein